MKNRLFAITVLLLLVMVSFSAQAATTRFWQHRTMEDFMEGKFQGTGITSEGHVVPTWPSLETTLPGQIAWGSASRNNITLVGTSQPGRLYRTDKENDKVELKKLIRTDGLGFTALVSTGRGLFAAESPAGNIYRYSAEEDTAIKLTTLPDSYILTMIPDQDNEGFYVGTGNNASVYHVAPDGEVTLTGQPRAENRNIESLVLFDQTLFAGDDFGMLYRVKDNKHLKPVYGFPNSEIKALEASEHYLYLAVNGVPPSRREQREERKREEQARAIRKQINIDEQPRSAGPSSAPGENKDLNFPGPEEMEGEIITPVIEPEEIPGDKIEEISPDAAPEPALPDQIPEELRQILEREAPGEDMEGILAGREGGTVFQMKPDNKLNILLTRPESPVNDLALINNSPDKLLVGAGNPGRVYKIETEGTHTLYTQPDQNQVTGLEVVDNQLVNLTTASNGALYSAQDFKPENTRFRSPPLDANLLSRWGQFQGYSEGDLSYRLRSGIAGPEETEWADWSDWQTKDSFHITVDPARHLQYEVQFEKETSQLRKTEIAYRSSNQRPQIVTFQLEPDPVKQKLFEEGPARMQAGRSREPAIMRLLAGERPPRRFQWRALDPDGDDLTASLKYRPEDSNLWVPLPGARQLKENEFEWNPNQLADGFYDFKLVVTDKPSNPPEESYRVTRTIGPVRVDNSRPEFTDVEKSENSISFRVEDSISRIINAHYRVNGGDWRKLRPLDGIYGARVEDFSFTVPEAKEENVFVEITILDENGNENMLGLTLTAP